MFSDHISNNAIISGYRELIITLLNVYKAMAVDEVQDNIPEIIFLVDRDRHKQDKTITVKGHLGCHLSYCPCVKSWQEVMPF